MLPFAPPLTSAAATSWLDIGVPRWVTSRALTAGWVLAIVAAAVGSGVRPCTPDNPEICGADQGFAWWVVLCFATPLLLIWLPLMGCAAGVTFALADLAYDDVTSGRIGFGMQGLACAVVAVWLLRSAAEQERAAAVAGARIRAGVPPAHHGPAPAWNWVRVGAASALVLVGVGLIGWYSHDVSVERSHLSAAERVNGRVVAVDDENFTILLDAAARPGVRRVQIEVLDTLLYPMGTSTPVLLDPGDLSWSRLVAEPQDASGWETAGLLAFFLASLLACRELLAWRERQRLWAGEHPAWRVWVIPDENGDALLFPDDGARPKRGRCEPIARVPLVLSMCPVDLDEDWEPDDRASTEPGADHDEGSGFDRADGQRWDAGSSALFGRIWRGEQDLDQGQQFYAEPVEPVQAVLLGTLRDRGWAMLVTENDVLTPAGPLRARVVSPDRPTFRSRLLSSLPFGPWREQIADGNLQGQAGRHSRPQEEQDDDFLLPGVPVSSSGSGLTGHSELSGLPKLPLMAEGPARARTVGAAMLAAALAGAPAAMLLLDLSWHERGVLLFFGGNLLLGGVGRALHHVRLTDTHLEVAGSFRVQLLPWGRLHGVRRDGATLAIACEPDLVIEVGPFEAGVDGSGQEPRAEELGVVMERLRERALSREATGGPVSSRPGPAWVLSAVYLVAMGMAFWIAVRK